jgi:hypothetical protein
MGQAAVLKAQQHSQRHIGARWESVLRPLVDAKSRPSTESTAPGSAR